MDFILHLPTTEEMQHTTNGKKMKFFIFSDLEEAV